MSDLLTKRQYQALLTDLRRIIREGKEEAERAAAQALIESYWSMGKRIYVAHVFYAFNNRGIESTCLKGRYLNQELVNKGFAKVV